MQNVFSVHVELCRNVSVYFIIAIVQETLLHMHLP